jgi:hypothetical protein
LVHGVTSEVDVRLAKISARSRNILLVLSSVKRRPPQEGIHTQGKGERAPAEEKRRESPARRKEKLIDRREKEREKKKEELKSC